MNRGNGHIYEFGEFRLNPAENLLLRDGEPVSLQPKAFSALVLLVERHGKLVEKSELLEKVWEDAFVEEAAVSRCIWSIRNALGEDSKDSRYIQTVPKRGYRFVGEVKARRGDDNLHLVEAAAPDRATAGHVVSISRSGPLSASVALAAEPVKDTVVSFPVADAKEVPAAGNGFRPVIVPPISDRRPRYALLAAIAVVIVAIAATGFLIYRPTFPGDVRQQARIAVLPLKPVNPADRNEGIDFAIAESLILKIGAGKHLSVTQLSAVRKFVELEKDPIEAGRELGVDYVLASNYQAADGRIRVTSHLLNVMTGGSEQTFVSETNSGSVFAVQDHVANEIGNAVFARFGAPATSYAAARGTESEEAYRLYHEAMYLNDKFTTQDSAKAVELLDRAIALDPNFAQAWAVKAHAQCQFAHLGGGEPIAMFKLAEPNLNKSLELNDRVAIAYMVKATLNRDYHLNFEQAYKDLQKSLEIDPNVGVTRRVLSGVMYRDGRFQEAVDEQKRAIDLNPVNPTDRWILANYYYGAGRHDEAVAILSRLTEMEPSWPWSHNLLYRIYQVKGEKEKAYESFIKFREMTETPPEQMEKYRLAYQASGWDGVLRYELDFRKSNDKAGEYSGTKYYIATLAAQLGEQDLAFRYLEESYNFRLIDFSYLKVDPLLEPLRTDPRFGDLVKRSGL